MDARIQTMLDHFEIRRVLAQYCHGCDRGDAEVMADVYFEDSWDNHGTASGPGREFARSITQAIDRDCDVMWHSLGQSIISVTGDFAKSETYFFSVNCDTDEAGARTSHQMGGRYVDELERIDGEWRIRDRIAVRDWSVSHAVTRDDLAAHNMTAGSRGMDDAGVRLIGIAHIPRGIVGALR